MNFICHNKFYLRILFFLIPGFLFMNSLECIAFISDVSDENPVIALNSEYYVSKDGNDSNSGLSPELAWKTVGKVNSYTFLPGDRILFRRGDEWREMLSVSNSGTSDSYITYSSYGTGAKPIFNGADVVKTWLNEGTNVWSADCPVVSNFGYNFDYTATMNGALLTQVGSKTALYVEGEYFIDTTPTPDKCYVYSTTDPKTKEMEISSRMAGATVLGKKYIKIEKLDFRNAAHCGIFLFAVTAGGQFSGYSIVDSCTFYRNRISGIFFDNGYSNNTVQNCTSTYNGNGYYSWSSQTYGSDNNVFTHCYSGHNIKYLIGTVTDGHGFGIFNCNNNLVQYCESEDDYYGINSDANGNANNVIYRYNYVHDTRGNTPGLALGQSIPVGTIHLAYNNLIINTGVGEDSYGISIGRFREGQVYLFNNTIYQDGKEEHSGKGLIALSNTNIVMKNNIIFSNALNASIMIINGDAGFVSENNLFYAPNDMTNILTLNGTNYHTLSAWRSAIGQDTHSIYGDPLFVNSTSDWTLQSGSPAINAGIDVGLKNDLKGNPIIGIPDIGAFESQIGTNIPIPLYLSSVVQNFTPSVLELTFDLTLADILPAASAFSVKVNTVTRNINTVAISGAKVLLTLASPAVSGDVVTVAYTKPVTNPLQTTSGGQVATMSAQIVTNNVNPIANPVYIGSVIENFTPFVLEMVYNLNLAAILPAASAFSVRVNSVTRNINAIAISGVKVLLTLSSPVVNGDLITIAYTSPATNPLQTAQGGLAATISAQFVTNNVNPVVSPVYIGSVIGNVTPSVLEMIYNLSLANILPAPSAFSVRINSVTRNVNTVAISGTKVLLTLASPVVNGDVITIAYTRPANNPLQTASGEQAATLSPQSVTNNVNPVVSLVYIGSAIENATPSVLEIVYNLSLAGIVPAASAFSVRVNSVSRNINTVAISGVKVLLTLSSPVVNGDVITVAYTRPATNSLQTASGEQAATFGPQIVTNNVYPVANPAYIGSVIENDTPSVLEMVYNLKLAGILPAASAFSVLVNSVTRNINTISITETKVLLTLTSPVVYGDIITIAYTRPATNPLQTASGGQAATFSAQSVINNLKAINNPPIVVIKMSPNNFSGFVGEIDATGSYDPNNDNLSFNWVVPANIFVSSLISPKIQFLGPIVNPSQIFAFTLHVSDGIAIQSKAMQVEILPYKPELEVAEVLNVEASSFQSPNYPQNVLDGNTRTMWAANGSNQWLLLELKEPFNIQHVRIAFNQGLMRESYFDIFGSMDKKAWEPVLTRSTSCAFSGDFQVFEFPLSKIEKKFKYVKFVGQSNSVDSWNYISEFRIFGSKNADLLSFEKQPVKIFPNPAHEFITIRIEETTLKPDFLRIITLSGKAVFLEKCNPDIKELQIPINLFQGVYILQIGSGNLVKFSQKLIVGN
jgi:uncharacterized repeat protein (TIGR02059 family)